MTSTKKYLVPQEASKSVLAGYCQDLLTAHEVAKGCAETLIKQPPFSNNLLITLPEDQALAVQHARSFLKANDLGFADSKLTELRSMAETIIPLLNGLMDTAKKVQQETPDSHAYQQSLVDFQAVLDEIVKVGTDVNPNSGSLLDLMKTMNTTLTNLSQEIANDATRLRTAVQEVKDDDKIAGLLAQQKGLQSQLANVNKQIAQGATTTIVSDIEFGFSLSMGFIDGLSPGAVSGAAMTVVGEVGAIQQFDAQNKALRDQQKSLEQQISSLNTTIASDQADAATLTLVAAQVEEFNTRVKSLLATSKSIVDQMTNWKEQLNVFTTYSVAPPSKDFLTTEVNAGLQFWTALQDDLNRYLNIMNYTQAAKVPK